MKEILDIIVIVLFVFILFVILRGFNKQQIKKHTDLLDKAQERRKKLDD